MDHTTPPPGFPPPFPPEPPAPPRKPRANLVIIGSAAAVIAAIAATGVVVVQSRDDDKPAAGSTESATPVDDAVTAAEEPEPTPEDTGPDVFKLTDTVAYETGVEVSLSKFTRGTSNDYASPENTPYVKFTVKVKNGSTKTLNAPEFSVSCSYGEDGQVSESVFDEGLHGAPETRLLAGRSISVPWGCALPKGESVLQVEVTPDFESETAIFTGTIK